MEKHAYLIMAHNQYEMLENLCMLLDDYQNDIYIHVDKKYKNFNFKRLASVIKKSNLIFVKRYKIFWGGYSQIQAELSLLETATKSKHCYYHLLSGADLPLKSQKRIHEFFDENKGTNFIQFQSKNGNDEQFKYRYELRYVFQSALREKKGIKGFINRGTVYLQKKYKFLKKSILDIYKGANWFSITHELAEYVVANEKLIKKQFSYTLCGDELFLQSIVMKSPFVETLSVHAFDDSNKGFLRYIDWQRGTPYIWKSKDYDELISSKMLFARKFDWEVDRRIIKRVSDYVKE